MKSKEIKKRIKDSKKDLEEVIYVATESGFYTEVIVRSSALMDEMIVGAYATLYPRSADLIFELHDLGALNYDILAKGLVNDKYLAQETYDKMRKVKKLRNVLAHKPHGDLDYAFDEHYKEEEKSGKKIEFNTFMRSKIIEMIDLARKVNEQLYKELFDWL